ELLLECALTLGDLLGRALLGCQGHGRHDERDHRHGTQGLLHDPSTPGVARWRWGCGQAFDDRRTGEGARPREIRDRAPSVPLGDSDHRDPVGIRASPARAPDLGPSFYGNGPNAETPSSARMRFMSKSTVTSSVPSAYGSRGSKLSMPRGM